jgi:hypothetical protein
VLAPVEENMKLVQTAKTRAGTAFELLSFVWQRRIWMVPLILALLVIGALVALASAAAVFPFIYTLF